MPHALQADSWRFLGPAQTDTVIGHSQAQLIFAPFEMNPHCRRLRMTMNIHESFLCDSQYGDRNGMIGVRRFTRRFEGGVSASPPPKASNQCIQRRAQGSVTQFRGIVQESKRTQLLVDPPDSVLNILEQTVVTRVRVSPPQVRDTELKSNDELSGRVVKFLAKALSFVLVNSEQLIDQL
jgi:hypothetical protein